MIRGRRPKPTQQRILEGNPGKRPFNPYEPELPVVEEDNDEPPAIIAADDVAAAEWRRLAPQLRLARVLTDADTNALIAYCQQWSIYIDALGKAPPDKRVVRSPNDYPMINPYLSIANKALMFCDRLGDQLGLSPSSRARVNAQTEDGDPFAEFDQPPSNSATGTH